MKIAINCWVLRNKQIDGIGYFTINTVSRIIRDHPEVHFDILCDKGFTENYFDFPNVTKHHFFPPYRHPVLYVLYLEFLLPAFLKKLKPDLFLSAEGFLSLSASCKQVPIIYDINFEHKPEDMKLKNRIYFRHFYKRFVKKATRIATISEYSKQDIAGFYNADPARIDNVSCGINPDFKPLSQEKKDQVRARVSGGVPYFFFVGSMHPRKNILRLIQAYDLFRKQAKSNHKLVLAGTIAWSKSEIESAYLGSEFKADIIFTGRLSDIELQETLGAAFALSYVPIFEGFGLPIVEAMECGVPVLCANITSMPEVAGDAAILVDPFNINEIAAGMQRLVEDDVLVGELIQRGFRQKQQFSWDRTAALLWECMQKAISQ